MAKMLGGFILVACIVAIVLLVILNQQPEPMSPGKNVEISQVPVTAELPDGPAPKPDAIVFDVGYRGLDANDRFRYNSYWGYGASSDNKNRFIKQVNKVASKIKTVYNPNFKGAEWSAVELDGNKPLALYFDLNSDGGLTDNEKILPAAETDENGLTEFVTPDFVMTTQDGGQVPFRALLQVRFYGNSTTPNCMWSPSCVLEGKSADEKKLSLVLETDGFGGSFIDFGRGSYSLGSGDTDETSYSPIQTLSSLINYNGQFYRVRFLKNPQEKGAIRAVLEKDTSPTGKVAVKLEGKEGVKARLSSASLSGVVDQTIHLSVYGDKAVELPVGDYKINNGYIYYGEEDTDDWYVNFTEVPSVEVEADKTVDVTIGKPEMSISAVDQKDRYSNNVSRQSVYAKGTTIFLSPEIKGVAGEMYGRFRHKEDNRHIDSPPTVSIADAGGQQIASGTMEYG